MQNQKKIIIFHGLYMHGIVMQPLVQYLRDADYACLNVNYQSYQYSLAENAALVLPEVEEFLQGDPACFVGHSLGGLLIRHVYRLKPLLFTQGSIVTLGTPHAGSSFGRTVESWCPIATGKAWYEGLDGHAPALDPAIPLLSIAGTLSLGLGMWGIFGIRPNDGTVAVDETCCEEMRAQEFVPLSHTSLIYSKNVYEKIIAWDQSHTGRRA